MPIAVPPGKGCGLSSSCPTIRGRQYAVPMGKNYEVDLLDRDLTTEDLERVLTSVPQMLSDRGLRPSTLQTLFGRGADMYFSSATSPLDELLDVIAAAGASIVFIETEKFGLDDLFDEDDQFDAETAALAPLLKQAEASVGQLSVVNLKWSMEGQLCMWLGGVSWVGELREAVIAAAEEAASEERQSEQEEHTALYESTQRIVADMMANPAYKATPPHKRKAAAQTMLKDVEYEDGYWGQRRLLHALASADQEETQRQVMDIMGNLEDHATTLVSTDEWKDARNSSAKSNATIKYLTKISGGWRMQAKLADELRDLAVGR